jgi:Leucine-rich repeat (LRR) protein
VEASQSEDLSDLGNLKEIYLDHNSIRSIARPAFRGLKLRNLTLNDNNFTQIPPLDVTVTSLDLGNHAQSDVWGNEQHQPAMNKFEILEIREFGNLSGVEYLSVGHARIRWIVPGALTGFTNLKVLELPGNYLNCRSILRGIFDAVPQLQTLNMNSNQFVSLEHDFFKDLPQLTSLELRYNQIQYVRLHAFRGLNHLAMLDLSHNALQSLEGGMFEHIASSLQSLNLEGNLIYVVAQATFNNMSSLRPNASRLMPWTPPPPSLQIQRSRSFGSGNPIASPKSTTCMFTGTAVGSEVTCTCGSIGGDVKFASPDKQSCVCPKGWFGTYLDGFMGLFIECVPCQTGTYSDTFGATECLVCQTNYTAHDKSDSSDLCIDSAETREAKVKADAAKAKAAKLEILVICILIAAVLLGLLLLGLVCYFRKREIWVRTTSAMGEEIKYYRDWRIRPADLSFESEPFADGASGTVWKGRLHGHFGHVAIKVATPQPEAPAQVWRENEIAFLIAVRHPRLVTFVGAGERPHPEDNCTMVRFLVLEYMDRGSLAGMLWETQMQSITNSTRMSLATDIAEAMKFIHSNGCNSSTPAELLL